MGTIIYCHLILESNKHLLKAPGCRSGRAAWWRSHHQTGWASSCPTGNPSSLTHALPGCLCLCSNHRQENRGCDILISPKGGGEDVKLRKEPVQVFTVEIRVMSSSVSRYWVSFCSPLYLIFRRAALMASMFLSWTLKKCVCSFHRYFISKTICLFKTKTPS